MNNKDLHIEEEMNVESTIEYLEKLLLTNVSNIDDIWNKVNNKMKVNDSKSSLDKIITSLSSILENIEKLSESNTFENEELPEMYNQQQVLIKNIIEISKTYKTILLKQITNEKENFQTIQSKEEEIRQLEAELSFAVSTNQKTMKYLKDELQHQERLDKLISEDNNELKDQIENQLRTIHERISPLLDQLELNSDDSDTLDLYMKAIDQLEEHSDQLRSEIERLSLQLDQSNIQIHDNEYIIRSLQEKQDDIIVEKEKIKAKYTTNLENVQNELLQLKLDYNQLAEENKDLMVFKKSFDQIISEKDLEVLKLKEDLAKFSDNNSNLTKTIEKVQNDLNDLTLENNQLLEKFDQTTSDLILVRGEYHELQEKSKEFTSVISSLRSSLLNQKNTFIKIISDIQSKSLSSTNIPLLIEVLTHEPRTISEIAKVTGKSELKCYTILKELNDNDYIEFQSDGEGASYKEFLVKIKE
ncbi:MAG: hypothetical protein OEZ01_09400 [Candidatus Heimdallarchaeota archaeon]|nr:hypothetical protein [Candidatus Heimdallarchaeota archaeon]